MCTSAHILLPRRKTIRRDNLKAAPNKSQEITPCIKSQRIGHKFLKLNVTNKTGNRKDPHHRQQMQNNNLAIFIKYNIDNKFLNVKRKLESWAKLFIYVGDVSKVQYKCTTVLCSLHTLLAIISVTTNYITHIINFFPKLTEIMTYIINSIKKTYKRIQI